MSVISNQKVEIDRPQEPSLRLSPNILDLVTRVAWSCFHRLYGSCPKLGRTGVLYMKNGKKRSELRGVELPNRDELQAYIEALKAEWKWVIILNHASWIFADYLPIFWYIGDDILSETTIYTAGFNLAMNQAEFPDYDFRSVDPTTHRKKKQFLTELWARCIEIEREWGYIFIVPAWPGRDDGNKPFLAAFNHIVSGISPNTPVLALHISHDTNVSYSKILLARFWVSNFKTSIASELNTASEWQNSPKKHRRDFYNGLFQKIPTNR